MQVLIVNADTRSAFIFEDSEPTELTDNGFVSKTMMIPKLNPSNATLYTNVSNVPGDWEPDKYTFDGTNWTLV